MYNSSVNSPGAVVVGAHVNGLGVVRTLAARGIRIAIVSSRPFDMAQHSRYVSGRHTLYELHQRRESLVELLDRHSSRWRGWAVFPTNDDALTALAQHHEQLSHTYRLTCPPGEITGAIVDKDRMHDLAERVGLTLPVCYGAATMATAARADIRFPVVIKPIQHDTLISTYGVKLFIAHDRDELRQAIGRLVETGLDGLVYEFVPGADREIVVCCVHIDAHGEPSPSVLVSSGSAWPRPIVSDRKRRGWRLTSSRLSVGSASSSRAPRMSRGSIRSRAKYSR